MALQLPTLFSQFDGRWAGITLGNNTDSKYNIYNYGCLLNVLCAICEYYGIDTDPARLNQLLKDNGGFAQGSGEYNWGTITKVFSGLSENRTVCPDLLSDAQIAEIKNAIDAGFPVMIQIDYNPKTVELDSHFVCIIGYDSNDENNFTIFDPLGGKIHSLKDYLGWYKPSARRDIEQYIIYKGVVPSNADDSTMVIKKSIFPGLVHGSSQWDQAVHKYVGADADPNNTDFAALQSVVGGIQSTATSNGNKVADLTSQLATAQQAAANSDEKYTIEKQHHDADVATLEAQVAALTPSSDQFQKLKDTYDGQIADLKQQVTDLLKDKHDFSIQLARARAAQPPKGILETMFPTILAWLSKNVKK